MSKLDLTGNLSVILPTTLGNPRYLSDCISSLDRQTLEHFNLLVLVDGGDVSAELNEIFSSYSRPYRILFSRRRRGVSRSLNILARLCKTTFIARMDDDDIAHPDRLEKQLNAILGTRYDVVGSAVRIIDETDSVVSDKRCGFDFSFPARDWDLIFEGIFYHPTVIYRRDWILRHKYCRYWKNGQDRELWMRTYSTSNFFNLDDVLLDYRIRAKNHSVYRRAIKNKFLLIDLYVEGIARRKMLKMYGFSQVFKIYLNSMLKSLRDGIFKKV